MYWQSYLPYLRAIEAVQQVLSDGRCKELGFLRDQAKLLPEPPGVACDNSIAISGHIDVLGMEGCAAPAMILMLKSKVGCSYSSAWVVYNK
jgi:hypothetical protein